MELPVGGFVIPKTHAGTTLNSKRSSGPADRPPVTQMRAGGLRRKMLRGIHRFHQSTVMRQQQRRMFSPLPFCFGAAVLRPSCCGVAPVENEREMNDGGVEAKVFFFRTEYVSQAAGPCELPPSPNYHTRHPNDTKRCSIIVNFPRRLTKRPHFVSLLLSPTTNTFTTPPHPPSCFAAPLSDMQ